MLGGAVGPGSVGAIVVPSGAPAEGSVDSIVAGASVVSVEGIGVNSVGVCDVGVTVGWEVGSLVALTGTSVGGPVGAVTAGAGADFIEEPAVSAPAVEMPSAHSSEPEGAVSETEAAGPPESEISNHEVEDQSPGDGEESMDKEGSP